MAQSLTALENLLHVTSFIGKKADKSLAGLAGKTVLLYFSASWCPPCRGFTPLLKEFYDKHNESKNFEVIFCTWDEEEEGFQGYFDNMPWLAIPFDKADEVQRLTKHFNVQSIPTLIALNADTADVYTIGARNKVVSDPEGKDFPWKE